jgi:hypothetical protein
MTTKFKNVPTDPYTRITSQKELKLGDFTVLYQKWSWDGVKAESIIFDNNDIADTSIDDLTLLVKSSPVLNEDSQITVGQHGQHFTFFNFNFTTE